ncbi:hypothetical protein GCM10011394_25750 [Luteimonas terricola]|uniref:Small ribosomal subunit protein bS21 n=2 Tax=Lysobacteraceae TaxID=32033 RepID=A0ABQ2EKL6_9GAMM|nr:hypothetical protein GCM10011394_25750 [Luteimonas terricola]
MQGDLAVDGMRAQAGRARPAGVVHGDAGLIAAGFDSEDDHGVLGVRWSQLRLRPGLEHLRAMADWGIIRGSPGGNRRIPRPEIPMPSVKVRENEPFEFALRRFKRTCEKAGVLAETRKREYYEKPTQERKRKAAAAVKRQARRTSRDVTKRQRMY